MPNTISEAAQRRLNKLLGTIASGVRREVLTNPPAPLPPITKQGETQVVRRELTPTEERLRMQFGGTKLEQPLIQAIGQEGRPDPLRMLSIAKLLNGGGA